MNKRPKVEGRKELFSKINISHPQKEKEFIRHSCDGKTQTNPKKLERDR